MVYTSPNDFIKEILREIGAGRQKFEPHARDFHVLATAMSIAADRILKEVAEEADGEEVGDGIQGSEGSGEYARGACEIEVEVEGVRDVEGRYYLKSLAEDWKDIPINMLDQHRIADRIKSSKDCMVLYLPLERVQVNLNTMCGVYDLDNQVKYTLMDRETGKAVEMEHN